MTSRSAPRPLTRRPRGHWTSKNRMLSHGTKKVSNNVARNPNFDTDETKLLIQLWGDPKVQRTLITTHKKHVVILQLASKMRQYGYDRSAEEITTRIKNLKCFYNRLKKDMESSETTIEPTWRHYADMDEIMTRPIFSVRPNEVPAPSLKYQLEQKREEREQRKRKALEEGRPVSDSDEDIEDIIAVSTISAKQDISDDGIIPDAEVDIEAADKAFVALVQAAPKKRKLSKSSNSDASVPYEEQDDQDDDDGRLLIKEEFENIASDDERASNFEKNQTSKSEKEVSLNDEQRAQHSNTEDTNDSCVALIIPKDEPIEVDDDNDDLEATATIKKPTSNIAPSLSEMLKLTQNGMVAISSSTGNILIPVSSVATSNASSNASKVITTFSNNFVTTSTSSTLQPGKISIVPTNFLMQPKTMQTSTNVTNVTQTATGLTMPTQSLKLLKGQIPSRILLSGTKTNGQANSANTGIVTTGPGGMKVLLVNAEATGATGKMCMPSNLTSKTAMTKNTIGTVLPNVGANSVIQSQAQAQHISTQSQQLQQQQQSQQQPQQQQQQQQEKQQQIKRREEEIFRKRRERIAAREEREGSSMRNLLRTLVKVQNDNNEIQSKMLKAQIESNNLARQGLEFVKNAAERFFTVLPTLVAHQPQQQQFILHQQPKAQTMHQQVRLNPTKLVFATGTLPSSAIMTPSTTNVVSNIATSTTANDIQSKFNSSDIHANSDVSLLTPKVEKAD